VDIALDADGDLDFTDGELRLLTGVEAIAQHLRIRFRTFLGEWHLDQRIGIPYFQHVFVKNPNPVLIRSIFREVALGTPGVKLIARLELDLDRTTRTLSVSMSGNCDDGTPFDFDWRDSPLGVAA
jgi:hypothetical protein